MKKVLALLLIAVMCCGVFAACSSPAAETPSEPTTTEETPATTEDADAASLVSDAFINPTADWTQYNDLITQIKTETDYAKRTELMHKAEDILMSNYCILPFYYYNDLYMQKEYVDGIYANLFQTKFFMYATMSNGSDTLRLNLASEPDFLDPALNSSVDGACLAALSFSGLYTYDSTGSLVPALAESYEMSEDGLTYTFTLKDDLKWSDGSKLDANDFVYSWKRAANPETAADYAYMLNGIAGYPDNLQVSASEDGKVFTVVLSAPCAYFLDLAAFPTFLPVQQAYVEANSTADKPGAWCTEAGFVSNGAFTLTEWKHNESMTYTKNPNWYDADKVTIDKIEFMLSADDTAIYAAYQAGDLDFADSVPTDMIASLKEDPEFHVIDALGTYYAAFNVTSKLFDGKTVEQANAMREAFSKLIDRQYIVDTVAQCGQKVATSFIPAGMMDGNGGIFKENDDAYTYPVGDGYYAEDVDVEGAIELLKSAGYEFDDNGMLSASTPITLEYLVNESSSHIAIAECIQQDLAAVGITLTIRTCDWNVFLQDRKNGNYDFAREGWLADYNDPINMLEMWETDSGNNDMQFGR